MFGWKEKLGRLLEWLVEPLQNFLNQLSACKSLLKVATLVCDALVSSHSHVKDCPPDHSRVKQSDLAPQVGLERIQDENMEEHFTCMENRSKNHVRGRVWVFSVLGQLRFWMDTILVARWNGLEILIPKHMWKRKIQLLEQKLDENRYLTFF